MPTDNPNPRLRVTHPHSDDGQADQSDRRSSNINTIVAQYQRSGTLPAVTRRQPLFGDFTLVGDELMDLTEQFQNAQDRFLELPSAVRAAADNDWRKFLTMFDDDTQRETLMAAGLRVVDPPTPAAVPPAAPPPSAPPEPPE